MRDVGMVRSCQIQSHLVHYQNEPKTRRMEQSVSLTLSGASAASCSLKEIPNTLGTFPAFGNICVNTYIRSISGRSKIIKQLLTCGSKLAD